MMMDTMIMMEEPTRYFREGFETRVALKHEIGDLRGVLGIHGLFDELQNPRRRKHLCRW